MDSTHARSQDTPQGDRNEPTWDGILNAIGSRVWDLAGHNLTRRDIVFGATWQDIMHAVEEGILNAFGGCKCGPDVTGEDIDIHPDCPVHNAEPQGPFDEEAPF